MCAPPGKASGHGNPRGPSVTRVLVVLNSGSGSSGDASAGELSDALRPLGDVVFAAPEGDGFAEELRRAADGASIVVAAGGDGTVSRTVDALGERLSDIRLGVVPMGTGNDLARTLGMPEKPLEAAEAMARGKERAIDVWRADGVGASRLFVNACIGGFPVEVDERVGDTEKRVLGPIA